MPVTQDGRQGGLQQLPPNKQAWTSSTWVPLWQALFVPQRTVNQGGVTPAKFLEPLCSRIGHVKHSGRTRR